MNLDGGDPAARKDWTIEQHLDRIGTGLFVIAKALKRLNGERLEQDAKPKEKKYYLNSQGDWWTGDGDC